MSPETLRVAAALEAGHDLETANALPTLRTAYQSDGSPRDHYSPIAGLAAHKVTDDQLQRLLDDGIPSSGRSGRAKRAALLDYYTRQNELIDSLLETQAIHRGEYTNDAHLEEAQVARALNVSFAANCLLLVVRVGIAVLSGSLSLIIATLDAVLDVVSSAIMFYTSWQARRHNKYQYPVGKERMEPLGIIVFSVIMGTAACSVMMQGVQALVDHSDSELPMMGVVIGGTLGVVAMKLALFLYCRGSASPAVQAFALDHLNDVLVNGVGLAGALLGARVAYYWDPLIAIALSLWVVWAWGRQAQEQILNLVGRSAPPDLLQRLTYLTYYHDPRVQYIDTVRAFTLGSTYIAEVDIVLPEDMHLREAHNIGESLQTKLELLPEVGRAYVHLDYETTHAPEH